jgi:hypothetical protein
MNRHSTVAALALLASSCLALAASAKPLYLTVPRSYGTAESPSIDVAFESRGPVELRVLKPQSLEAFVRDQANLRRAWVAPPSYANPGRALSRGLNALRPPGDPFLSALDARFRKELAPALPPRPERATRPLARLAGGPERLVGVPPGMQLVRSQWLNLDLGGAERQFDVPGFGMWAGEGGYQERHVTLDPLPPGIYLVQVVQGRIEGQVVLVVSDLVMQVKQTNGQLLARVAGRDQRPKAGVQVRVYAASGARAAEGNTDAAGEATLAVGEPRVLVTASLGRDVAVVDTDFYSTLAVAPDVFIYSDRPIYKPGDEIGFRGLMRKPDGFLARLFAPRQRKVQVELTIAEGSRASATATTDEFGAFHGTLRVPADAAAGVVRLVAQLDDGRHQAEARVQDYVKPTFYVEVTPESEIVVPGGTIKARLRARRYAGGAPPGARYEVFLYRSRIESPSWVDDAGMGGQGSAVTYGTPSTTEGQLSIPQRLYSSVAARLSGGGSEETTWEAAQAFDGSGEAGIEVQVPQLERGDERLAWRYSLSVRARDDQGTFANASAALFLSPFEVMGTARFARAVVKRRGEVGLTVRATTLSGLPYSAALGAVSVALRSADGRETPLESRPLSFGRDGVSRTSWKAGTSGTLVARVSVRDSKGREWRGEAQTLVLGEGNEPVANVASLTLSALSEQLASGDEAELVALFPGDWGPGGKNQGPVWITLSGAALFATRLVQLDGRTLVYHFPGERRFGSAVYASVAYLTREGRWEERAVPFRIVAPERTLGVQVQPLRSEASPLTTQSVQLRVVDHRGRGVRAQLSVGVVDKAVYALQGEFRPRVLDFFYPMVRDNVASFSSAEFQGYGYGERLARSLRGARGYSFASIKPPGKRPYDLDRDTAFWSPAVVTDQDGRATVSFKLPSNQSLWVVTALAADASGRFGEATAEFATRGELNVYASLPQFLREGDEAAGSVRVSALQQSERLAVKLAVSGAAAGVETQTEVALVKGSEKIVPISLRAQKPGAAELAISVSGGREPLRDRRSVPVRAGGIEETVETSQWGGGELRLALPPGAAVESAELVLTASTVDAALANLRELLVYPYGCLEQLVATSVPNIAVAQTLQRIGAAERLDPDSQALLVEARSRAVQGTQRVLALAVKGGGFTWFGGYDTPSLPLTLIALDGLAYAAEAELVSRSEPRLLEGARWLEAQQVPSFELDAIRTYVLARLEGERHAARVRALLERTAESSDPYPAALAVLAAEAAGIVREGGVQRRLAELIARSREGFLRPAGQAAEPEWSWRYPLRRVGRMAVLAHAASVSGLDPGLARRRLVELLAEPGLSTFDRSTALLHSLWMIEMDARELRRLGPPRVEAANPVRFAPRGTGLVADLGNSAAPVRVGSFEGVATLRARVRTPLASVGPRAQGLGIAREYFLLRGGTRRRLGPGEAVAQGEQIYVELSLTSSSDRRSASAYTVIEDPIPAGFVALDADKPFRGPPHRLPLAPEALKRRTFTPERATFFLDEPSWWSDHPRTFGYVLRAQFPGRFSAPPATVEDMYSAQRRGRSAPAELLVAAGKDR